MKNIAVFILLISLIPIGVHAQTPSISKSTTIETINNQKYYIHTVQPKETIYAICKAYGISYTEFTNINPSIAIGTLNVGQTLKIPVTNSEKENISPQTTTSTKQPIAISHEKSKEIISINNESYYVHTVQQGQTLYFLSKLYEVSTTEILASNPEITENLSLNQKIMVVCKQCKPESLKTETHTADAKPNSKQPEIAINYTQISNPSISERNKKSIHIALLLPFYLELNNAQTTDAQILNKQQDIYSGTYPFLEYYEGVLLAVDSLKKQGISVTLEVFDSNKDTNNVKEILSKLKPENLDFIIGPIFPESFSIAAAYAKKNKIPIISPLSSDELPLQNNPYIIQVNCPQKYRNQEMTKFASQYHNCNIILVYNNEALEKKDVTECKRIFSTTLADSLKKNHIVIREVYFKVLGITGIENAMEDDKTNIVIVLSKEQAFINNIVTKLYQFSKKYDIHLYGMPVWERYENLELDFLFELQFQFVANGFINYSSDSVKHFIETYREIFKTEPTKFCFQGFDQMLFFSENLISDGNSFLSNIPYHQKSGLHDSYSFIKENANSGYINKSVQMIQYSKTFERKLIQLGQLE